MITVILIWDFRHCASHYENYYYHSLYSLVKVKITANQGLEWLMTFIKWQQQQKDHINMLLSLFFILSKQKLGLKYLLMPLHYSYNNQHI